MSFLLLTRQKNHIMWLSRSVARPCVLRCRLGVRPSKISHQNDRMWRRQEIGGKKNLFQNIHFPENLLLGAPQAFEIEKNYFFFKILLSSIMLGNLKFVSYFLRKKNHHDVIIVLVATEYFILSLFVNFCVKNLLHKLQLGLRKIELF